LYDYARQLVVGGDVLESMANQLQQVCTNGESWMAEIRGSGKVIAFSRMGSIARGDIRIWVLAILLLISSGVLYRGVTSRLQAAYQSPIKLPISLSEFPKEIGIWVGTDLPIRSTTKEYMEQNFADDYFSRRYINPQNNSWADVYVVYCSTRPGGILGHRPQVCYPGAGWIWDSTDESSFVTAAGKKISCLIHRFHTPEPKYRETVVLNFYILNGQITTRESDFSGLLGRRPNIAGNPARYVVQVQISSVVENSIREIAKAIADPLLDIFPDENGIVQVTGFSQPLSRDLK
jgi:EpsI family protein